MASSQGVTRVGVAVSVGVDSKKMKVGVTVGVFIGVCVGKGVRVGVSVGGVRAAVSVAAAAARLNHHQMDHTRNGSWNLLGRHKCRYVATHQQENRGEDYLQSAS